MDQTKLNELLVKGVNQILMKIQMEIASMGDVVKAEASRVVQAIMDEVKKNETTRD